MGVPYSRSTALERAGRSAEAQGHAVVGTNPVAFGWMGARSRDAMRSTMRDAMGGTLDGGRLLRLGRAWAAERLGWNERARARLDGSRAALLYYHRVLPQAIVARDHVEAGMFLTPERFEAQLDWLQAHFRILPLSEICERLASGRRLPPYACALSFDDGWRDNHDHALPALVRRSLPATIFVVTRRVGTQGAFWPDEVCRRLAPLSVASQRELVAELLGGARRGLPREVLLAEFKELDEEEREHRLDQLRGLTEAPPDAGRELMDWDEIERVAASGIEIESHGATHAILTGLPSEAVMEELTSSRDALLARGLGSHRLLAYPSGAFDARVQRAAQEAGYRAAVTIEPGLADAGHDPFALPRLCVHEGIVGSRAEFLTKIPGAA